MLERNTHKYSDSSRSNTIKYNDDKNYRRRSRSRSKSRSGSRSRRDKHNKSSRKSSYHHRKRSRSYSRSPKRSHTRRSRSRSRSKSHSPRNSFKKSNEKKFKNYSHEEVINEEYNEYYNNEYNNNSYNYKNHKFTKYNENDNNICIQNNQTIQNNYSNNTSNKEVSNTLIISGLGPDINKNILEDVINDRCLLFQTSMPEDIKFIEAIRVAYIIFPSIQAASRILESFSGLITINGNNYEIDYTPSFSNVNNPSVAKPSTTYITSLNSDNSQYTTSMETIVHEDWICDFCDCKNFSKRVACFKCKRPKTLNCRIIPVIKQKTTVVGEAGQVPPSSSLVVRGNIIKETKEEELLEIFSQFAQVKDIRMICEKVTGEPKEFAFIEYFSIEEATLAINFSKRCPLSIRGNPITVTYSKIKRDDVKDYTESFAAKNVYTGGTYDYTMNTVNNQVKVPYSDQIGNNVLSTINIANLPTEEQNRLINISNLQDNILKSQNTATTFTHQKDLKGDSNLKREMSEREKVELEMKKWKKKVYCF